MWVYLRNLRGDKKWKIYLRESGADLFKDSLIIVKMRYTQDIGDLLCQRNQLYAIDCQEQPLTCTIVLLRKFTKGFPLFLYRLEIPKSLKPCYSGVKNFLLKIKQQEHKID